MHIAQGTRVPPQRCSAAPGAASVSPETTEEVISVPRGGGVQIIGLVRTGRPRGRDLRVPSSRLRKTPIEELGEYRTAKTVRLPFSGNILRSLMSERTTWAILLTHRCAFCKRFVIGARMFPVIRLNPPNPMNLFFDLTPNLNLYSFKGKLRAMRVT